MNSKFLVLTGLMFLTFGCAHSSEVAKTDIPEDEIESATPQLSPESSRKPASMEEPTVDTCSGKKNKKNCSR